MNYAIIENGLVANVVVASEPFGDNWVRVPDGQAAAIGGRYDADSGTFHRPEPKPQPTAPLTKLQFRSRLTMAEKTAIYEAARSNAMVQVWLDDLAVAEEIRLDDPATIEGVRALEDAGLLLAGRANEILATTV